MKNIKTWVFVLIIVLISSILLFVLNRDNINKVCIEDNCFVVEVVDTPQDMSRGLMFREQLDENKGMFFVFEREGNYPFWMKNTLIPLDIIWISESGIIVDIKEAFPCESDPCPSINHIGVTKYVLEINKGLSSKLGINVGEKVNSSIIGDV
ncbi:MAG: DUF192 domain-containing protein [Nanoarchaeota archaeon]